MTGARPSEADLAPAFRRIKLHVLEQIQIGHWKEGDAIPSENALATTFGVSRMTANRALRELADDRVLVRVQGSGTFVAPQKVQSTLVVINNIADEVRARGHRHHSELHRLERIKATAGLVLKFEFTAARTLFHSLVVHFENEIPIQVEDRFVNPVLAPEYMKIDFNTTTANEYLMRVAPLSGVQYRIEAAMPGTDIASMLHMEEHRPCLVLNRKTRSRGEVASVVTLWHPADRFQFTGGS